MANTEKLQQISTQVRRDIIRMVTNAKSGHPGGSMSSADFMTALYFEVMNHNPETWQRNGKGQDMFVLSAGHLTPMYYSILSRAGYFPVSELHSDFSVQDFRVILVLRLGFQEYIRHLVRSARVFLRQSVWLSERGWTKIPIRFM